MLISFAVENFLSFRDKATFSMVASREKQHWERLPHIREQNLRLLPVAAIYGGNASGKTNFFKAINFARHLVIQGTKPDTLIPVEPYRLDKRCLSEPAGFYFELLAGRKCYEFGFRVTRQGVVEEWLAEILKTTEKELYRRKGDTISFDPALNRDDFLHFAFKGTRDNQLFLTNAVNQKVEIFKPIYDWFRDSLVLIAPDARFGPFEQFMEQDGPFNDFMNEALARLDTGIARIGGEAVPFENLPFPSGLIDKIKAELGGETTARVHLEPHGERYVISRVNDEIRAQKLVCYHVGADNREIKFDLKDESDGTLRVIDLLPAFLGLCQAESSRVYLIDEMDRSLHTLLTGQLLADYLAACGEGSRSQLLFTTHDVLLMDQKLLRRDEMWVAERDQAGCSELIPFSDYKEIRHDKDIRKSYLQGRLGGVPKILFAGPLQPAVEVAAGGRR
ncbi:MAG: abortive phage resistance protein [Deltaproteobacteria bacterium RIFOXYD12_FULL_57_12]|nr:MAG: abortive phage resistance protein [Deltaproteobacteria bacterium RIFOXYD12_FULL_57_12]